MITTTNLGVCKRCQRTDVGILTNGLCIRCDEVLYGKKQHNSIFGKEMFIKGEQK
jgi:hypothetical protein